MQISIKITVPSQLKLEQAVGLLLSFITAGQEIATGKRKATYFRHFWKERLSRGERRWLTQILSNFIIALSEKTANEPRSLSESGEDQLIPKRFAEIIRSFQKC
jgi:hypothetical protein